MESVMLLTSDSASSMVQPRAGGLIIEAISIMSAANVGSAFILSYWRSISSALGVIRVVIVEAGLGLTLQHALPCVQLSTAPILQCTVVLWPVSDTIGGHGAVSLRCLKTYQTAPSFSFPSTLLFEPSRPLKLCLEALMQQRPDWRATIRA